MHIVSSWKRSAFGLGDILVEERGVGPSLEQRDDRRARLVSMERSPHLENLSSDNKRQANRR